MCDLEIKHKNQSKQSRPVQKTGALFESLKSNLGAVPTRRKRPLSASHQHRWALPECRSQPERSSLLRASPPGSKRTKIARRMLRCLVWEVVQVTCQQLPSFLSKQMLGEHSVQTLELQLQANQNGQPGSRFHPMSSRNPELQAHQPPNSVL